MNMIRVSCLGILASFLSACVAQAPSGNTTLGMGCTEDFVTYKRELQHLIEEGKDLEAQKRLEEIIKYVECEEEEDADAEKPK